MTSIQKVLNDFIDGISTFDIAAEKAKSIIGTPHPLERIKAVLQVDDSPLPSTPNSSMYTNLPFNLQTNYRKKTHPWTEIEDQRLLNGIHKFGLDNWAAVSAYVGNARTRAQCSQRWFRGLDPRISKVLWTPEEDNKLKELVEKYGDRCWTKIAMEIGSRSDAQCRYHYRQLMKDREDETNSNINQVNSESKMYPVSSVPGNAFKAQMRIVLPSQSLYSLQTVSTIKKIPPIDSFSEVINSLPSHLKFKLPPTPAAQSIISFKQE